MAPTRKRNLLKNQHSKATKMKALRDVFRSLSGFAVLSSIGFGLPGVETAHAQEPERFPPEAIIEDFSTLYRDLQDSAYDLFIYTEKAEFDAEYERILGTITEPMTAHEVGRLFLPFVVMARMSHCSIEMPSGAYRDWYRSGGRWFPFDLAFDGVQARIAVDWSTTDGIDAGDELVAVHGTPTAELMAELYRFVPGESDHYKRASLEIGELWAKYWLSFGDFETGPVRVRKKNGREVELEVSGIDLESYRTLSESLTEPGFLKGGRDFRFIEDIAYLRPGAFMNLSSNDGSEQEAYDNTTFLSFIDSVFTEIAARGSENLILDLRGNPGGGSSFSNPMIAYLADRPFREASEIRFRTSRHTKAFWRDYEEDGAAELKRQILTRKDGERWSDPGETHEPRGDSLRFKGQVLALIDRFSFSNAAAVASILQDYDFATMVGEETAYNPSNCGAIHTFRLPHTQLEVVYPKACGVRPSGDAGPHGVIPDHPVRQDYFTERDEILDTALALLKGSGEGAIR